MQATLDRKKRKARKPHSCDFCGKTIEKGEIYDWSKHIYDDDLYEWHSHERCSKIATEIRDYADPDEGMCEEDFSEGCRDICQQFVCPDCPRFNREYEECEDDKAYCTECLADFFETQEIYKAGRDGFAEIWKSRPRREND